MRCNGMYGTVLHMSLVGISKFEHPIPPEILYMLMLLLDFGYVSLKSARGAFPRALTEQILASVHYVHYRKFASMR